MARTYRIGRYSGTKAFTCLDGRTRESKFARAVENELVGHVGGRPSVAQYLLIRLVAIKALRLALMTNHVLTEQSINERDDRQFLCWANSLRRDLDVLGITRRAEASPRLAELLGHRAA